LLTAGGAADWSSSEDESDWLKDSSRPKFLFPTESFCCPRTSIDVAPGFPAPTRECFMEQTLVRYRTKPKLANENQRLIEAVFQE
jgi:hypothetical protein